MLESELARALRACRRLNGKAIVLELDAALEGEALASYAGQVALLRALGVHPIVIAPAGPGSGALDAQAPALRFVAAVASHAETAVVLPATSVLRVHRAGLVPLPSPLILVHLCSLGYVPVLLLPVADPEGAPVELDAAVVAAMVAGFTEAAAVGLATPRAPERLLHDILLPESP